MADLDYSVYYGRFHDNSESHARKIAGVMRWVLGGDLPADRSAPIVDIGCGYGFTLRALRDAGYSNLVGLEISTQQAEQAKRAGFVVEVTDDTTGWLRERPGRFALAVLFDVLEHVPPSAQVEFLRSIHASLKPGGVVLLTVPNANAILSSRWRYNDFTHHSSFTEHSLFFVLKNAGFESIEMDTRKGLRSMPWRLWRAEERIAFRKWLIRWCWLQVHKAEIPWENLDDISFELNLRATAAKAND